MPALAACVADRTADSGFDPTQTSNGIVRSCKSGKSLRIKLRGSDEDRRDRLTFQILGPPAHGRLSGAGLKKGRLKYVPAGGFVGEDRFTFKAVDRTGLSSRRGTVRITVRAADAGQGRGYARRPRR